MREARRRLATLLLMIIAIRVATNSLTIVNTAANCVIAVSAGLLLAEQIANRSLYPRSLHALLLSNQILSLFRELFEDVELPIFPPAQVIRVEKFRT